MSTYQCCRCKFIGSENVHTVVELRDNMYDRPPTHDHLQVDSCPECQSTDYRLIVLCAECQKADANEEGTDYCKQCFPIVEARENADFQDWKQRFAVDVKAGLWPAKAAS